MPEQLPRQGGGHERSRSDAYATRGAEHHALAALWGQIDRFCTERGWSAELDVRTDRDQFGRVAARVHRATEVMSAFGDTTTAAVRGLVCMLDRDGFSPLPDALREAGDGR